MLPSPSLMNRPPLSLLGLVGLMITLSATNFGCKSDSPSTSQVNGSPKKLVASSYMLACFAQELAPEGMEVSFPVPKDVDPGYWHPTADDIQALQQADLIVLNGSTYESWLDAVSIDESKWVDTTVGMKNELIESGEVVTHSHGPDGEHTHAGVATQLWLDPALALRQASVLETALAARSAESQRPQITANAVALNKKLVAFEEFFQQQTNSCRGLAVIASHPVYQYLGRRLDWQLASVHWEPGETPSDEEFTALQELVTTSNAKLMIWEGEPTPETRERVEAMGLVIVVYDPCFQTPETGDWFTVMHENVERLAAGAKAINANP